MNEPGQAISPQPASDPTAKARRIAVAFQSVFGQAAGRSADQKIVWSALAARACAAKPIFTFDRDGATDALTAAHRDGARTLFLSIERELQHAAEANADKPKVKTRR